MTFQDFLEHFYSCLKKGVPRGLGVPPELAPLGDTIKLLVYDGQGFWLAQKRLSAGTAFAKVPND